MDKKVNKKIEILLSNNKKIQLPIIESSEGPDVIDVRNLYKDTGYFTFDPGFISTAACESKITYIDGENGIWLCEYHHRLFDGNIFMISIKGNIKFKSIYSVFTNTEPKSGFKSFWQKYKRCLERWFSLGLSRVN